MSEFKTYSLSELKKMPKEEVIKLDMRQLPLPENVLSYFHNRWNMFLKRKESNPTLTAIINYDYHDSITGLYIFSLANILLSDSHMSGKRSNAILDLCDELEMKRGDIFSFNYHLSMPNELLLQCPLKNLCFPKSGMPSHALIRYMEVQTLIELLSIDIEIIEPERYHGYGPTRAKKTLDHILNMGFEMDSYPFLKKTYWEKLKLSIDGKKYQCIKEGSRYKQYGVQKPYAIVFPISGELIIPFEGTYKQCVAWFVKNTKKYKQ